MKKNAISNFFLILSKINPAPKTELDYTNAYTLLVAVVLSAQATDKGVNKVTKDLFMIADTPEKMLKLGEDKLKEKIKTIGLFNTKAKNIIKLSTLLITKFSGKIPKTRAKLEELPGVGRKTANVVLNQAYGMPTIAVDTHIFRVSNRTGMAEGKTPLEVEKKLEKNIPKKWKLHAHHWLILQGRYICKARKPLCEICPVYDYCGYSQKKR